MSIKYEVEYTDTYGGEANYCWVKRATITVPELTHYGYTDGSYARANRIAQREIMKQAKAAMGLTGVRGRTYWHGDGDGEFRPYGSATVMFINYME